ncbi:MAG: regulatory iron-sulfur-containing complex subunit RicT [Planctomycetota bacterium]
MKLVTRVRYGRMNYRELFELEMGESLRRDDRCVIRSPRGIEMGKVLAKPVLVGEGGCQAGEVSQPEAIVGQILRRATAEDLRVHESFESRGTDAEMAFCEQAIRHHGLPMKLAGAEYLLAGEKLVFFFLADGRVDFRALVRDLAREFHTRIEMKQIGSRDEARLIGDWNAWGRELCCRSFLGELQPVTMKMAKLQVTTLDPAKLSGMCSKLKCCLRYEDETYSQLKAELPRKGSRVRTAKGRGIVVGHEILAQLVHLQFESGQRQTFALAELVELDIDESGHGKLTAAGQRGGEVGKPVRPGGWRETVEQRWGWREGEGEDAPEDDHVEIDADLGSDHHLTASPGELPLSTEAGRPVEAAADRPDPVKGPPERDRRRGRRRRHFEGLGENRREDSSGDATGESRLRRHLARRERPRPPRGERPAGSTDRASGAQGPVPEDSPVSRAEGPNDFVRPAQEHRRGRRPARRHRPGRQDASGGRAALGDASTDTPRGAPSGSSAGRGPDDRARGGGAAPRGVGGEAGVRGEGGRDGARGRRRRSRRPWRRSKGEGRPSGGGERLPGGGET